MGYVGNQTTNAYSSMDKQTITGNGGASYTLTHAVANAQEIEVFVNNVRQEAGVAYTVNGTALSMTGNVASTDDFYVIYQGKALQTVVPPDGSVSTGKLASGAVTDAKIDTMAASKLTGTIDDARMPAGAVVQTVFSETSTQVQITSTTKGSGTETGVQATITPHSSSNKLLIQVNLHVTDTAYTPDSHISLELHDGTSIVWTDEAAAYYHNAYGDEAFRQRASFIAYIDAPSSATTYKVRAFKSSSGTFYTQRDSNPGAIVIQEIQQ